MKKTGHKKSPPPLEHHFSIGRKKYLPTIIGVILFVLLLLLPSLISLEWHFLWQGAKISYGLMFKYFLTGNPPPYFLEETPKPLVAFFYYLLPPQLIYLLVIFLVTLGFIYFVKMTKLISSSFLPGILAYLNCLLLFEDAYLNLLGCYWVWLYIPLALIAFYYLFAKDFLRYSIYLTLSGLIRPESWFLALLILIYALYKKFPQRYIFLIPFLAPLLWVVFDARAFHNPFYSFVITARYPIITGVPATKFFQFFPMVIKDLSQMTGFWFLFIGFIGALTTLFLYRQKKLNRQRLAEKGNYWLFFIIAFAPFIFYLILSLREGVVVMRRFFLLSLIFFAFYAFNLPNLFFQKPSYKRVLPLLIFILLLLLNFSLDRMKGNYEILQDAAIKIKTIENSLEKIKSLTDSLKEENKLPKWLIVPFRRKSAFEFYLPIYQNKIESFREIVAMRKELREYAPSLVYFLREDFAGLEQAFNFLNTGEPYRLTQEGVSFTPLFSQPRYIIYLLDNL